MNSHTSQMSPAEARQGSALYVAWRARIDRYLDEAFESMSRDDKVAALSQPNDFWTMLATLTLSPAQVSDPERRVRLRGAIMRRKLLESHGGCLSATKLADALGISRQGVNQRRLAGGLLGLPDGNRYLYPRCQLDANGVAVVAGLSDVLKALQNADPWSQYIFLVSRQDALDGGVPAEVLAAGSVEPVLRAARLHDTQDTV